MTTTHANNTICEIIVIARELSLEIRHHLEYYRASVYKHEAATIIREKISSLRTLIDLIPCDSVEEPLLDYDSEQQSMTQLTPGETLFTMQVSRLLVSLDLQLNQTQDTLQDPSISINIDSLKKEKEKILSLCHQGSQPWQFFQEL